MEEWPFSRSDAPTKPRPPVLKLRGCHTQGSTLDQVMGRTREAIALCVEEQSELGSAY
jgi:hypothetical protein